MIYSHRFLFDTSNPVAVFYQNRLSELKKSAIKREVDTSKTTPNIKQEQQEQPETTPNNSKRQKRRWDDSGTSPMATASSTVEDNIPAKIKTEPLDTPSSSFTSSAQSILVASSSGTAAPDNFMSEFEKAKALVRAKAQALVKGNMPQQPAVAVKTEEDIRREKEVEEQKLVWIYNISYGVFQKQFCH